MKDTVPTGPGEAMPDDAHVVVRYDHDLEHEWRIHYDHDGDGNAVLVTTFGPQIPSDPALQQMRAMSGAPRYELGDDVRIKRAGSTSVAHAYDRGYAEGIERARELHGRGLDPELWDGETA